MELVAGVLLNRLNHDRHIAERAPKDQIGVAGICAAIAECGISPEVFADACAIELGGWKHSVLMYDELDHALSTSLGEDFAQAFVERLSETENHFRQRGITVY